MGRIEHTLVDEGRTPSPTDLRPSPATPPYDKSYECCKNERPKPASKLGANFVILVQSQVEPYSRCTEDIGVRFCLPPTDKGGRMEGSSGNVVLLCGGCGERTTLGDPLSVWRSGRTSFECGCGASLTLSDRLEPGETSELIEASAAGSHH
jgi:hypothetical protein